MIRAAACKDHYILRRGKRLVQFRRFFLPAMDDNHTTSQSPGMCLLYVQLRQTVMAPTGRMGAPRRSLCGCNRPMITTPYGICHRHLHELSTLASLYPAKSKLTDMTAKKSICAEFICMVSPLLGDAPCGERYKPRRTTGCILAALTVGRQHTFCKIISRHWAGERNRIAYATGEPDAEPEYAEDVTGAGSADVTLTPSTLWSYK